MHSYSNAYSNRAGLACLLTGQLQGGCYTVSCTPLAENPNLGLGATLMLLEDDDAAAHEAMVLLEDCLQEQTLRLGFVYQPVSCEGGVRACG